MSPDLCRVHDAKPAQCRELPLRWRNPDSFLTCPGLRALARGATENSLAESAENREFSSHAESAE